MRDITRNTVSNTAKVSRHVISRHRDMASCRKQRDLATVVTGTTHPKRAAPGICQKRLFCRPCSAYTAFRGQARARDADRLGGAWPQIPKRSEASSLFRVVPCATLAVKCQSERDHPYCSRAHLFFERSPRRERRLSRGGVR